MFLSLQTKSCYKSCCVYNLIFLHNDNMKQKQRFAKYTISTLTKQEHAHKTAGSRNSYSTDILFRYHSQPALNPYNTPSLKVLIYSHYHPIQGRKRLASSWAWAFILSRITKGEKNVDDDGLSQEINYITHVTGKGWKGIHGSWWHLFLMKRFHFVQVSHRHSLHLSEESCAQ